jgi:hypothetical protein
MDHKIALINTKIEKSSFGSNILLIWFFLLNGVIRCFSIKNAHAVLITCYNTCLLNWEFLTIAFLIGYISFKLHVIFFIIFFCCCVYFADPVNPDGHLLFCQFEQFILYVPD